MDPADQYKDYDRGMLILALIRKEAELIKLRSKTIDDLIQDKIDAAFVGDDDGL